jgi:hypothetical protein
MTRENLSDYDIPSRRFNFHEDLKFGKKGEKLVEDFLDALSEGSFEVKTDRYRNGRMVIETMQNPRKKKNEDGTAFWKPSGIEVTKAKWWVYVYTLDNNEGAFVVVAVERIKRYINAHQESMDIMDFAKASSNPCKGYLLQPEQVMDMLINKEYDC